VVAILLLLCAVAKPAPATPLTIGSPAPGLAAMTFVRGEPVKELAKGTTYFIEFSGTNCGPCIRAIPHVNALQKKHSEVIFLSVFCQDKKTVSTFLDGPGKAMAIRVAVDPESAMWKSWADPACREGIPCAFIVDKDGRIGWIGHPEEMEEPLAGIVAGNFNAQEHVLRLKVEQEAVQRQRRMEEREEKGRAEYNRINELIIGGKLADALAETDRALAAFRDAPQSAELLQGARVYLLANLPGQREKAFELAAEMAIAARMSGRSTALTNTGVSLLNAAERAKPTERDTRLIDLALPLLRVETPADLNDKPESVVADHRIASLRLVGYAYHLRGDPKRATAAIREAMAMVRALKMPSGADATAFEARTAQRVKDLESILKEYETSSPGVDRR
jgi:thiol-disulfide isomerase/thioredoxin